MVFLSVGWSAVNYPGLSQMGLWDPWEMNRTQMARQMNEQPHIFVVEGIDAGESFGPIGQWLAARYESNLHVSTVDAPVVTTRSRKAKTTPKASVNLEKALTRLDEKVVQMIVIDVASVVPDPDQASSVKVFTSWLDRVHARNPGVPCLLVVRSDQPKEYISELRIAIPAARARLAANDLSGTASGRPGAFRKSLHAELRKAAKDGYSPVHPELIRVDKPESFMDEAFWSAAKQHRLKETMTESLPQELLTSLEQNEHFALSDGVVTWPSDEEYRSLRANFSTASSESRALMELFEEQIDSVFGSSWERAALKHNGYLRTSPPLDSWLIAQSMGLFGFSERAVRLPTFLIGLLGVLLLYWIVWRVWNGAVALLSGLVLITCPLYFAQGHLVASELSFVVSLILMLGGLLFLIQEEFPAGSAIVMVVFGGVIAFLSQGVYGLIFPTIIAWMYLLITRKGSLSYLSTTLLLTLSLGIAWFWTHSSGSGAFASQFGLQNVLAEWKVNAADRPIDLNFDVLIRQIGFGAAPWSALLPLAFAGLVIQRIPEERRPAVLVSLWFIVPYVIQSLLLKDCTHLVFPAIPALAVAVGLLLDRLLRGQALGLIGGVIVLILSGILINELKKTPEPFTSFITVDPPMYGKTDTVYPEVLKLSKPFLALLGLIAVMFFVHAARVGTRLRRLLSALSSPKAFWILFTVFLSLLTIRFVTGLEGHIADLYAAGGPARHLEPVHRLFVRSVLYWRVETWAVAGLGICVLSACIWHHTAFFSHVRRWVSHWVLNVPTVFVLLLSLGLGAAFTGLSGSRNAVESVISHGLLPASILGLVMGCALIVASARHQKERTFVRWVVLVAFIRLCVQPGAEWLMEWSASSSWSSYALFEAVFTAGIALVLGGIGWLFAVYEKRLLSRLLLLSAAVFLALPTIDPANVWDLLLIASSRMLLLVTLVDVFRGSAIVGALGQRINGLDFLVAPLAAMGLTCVGVVIGASLLALAVMADSYAPNPIVGVLAHAAWVLVVVLAVGLVVRRLPVVKEQVERLSRVGQWFRTRISDRVIRWQEGLSWLVVCSLLAVVLLSLALERTIAWGTWSEEFVSWATVDSPLFRFGIAVLIGWSGLALLARWRPFSERVLSERSWLFSLRSLAKFRIFWIGAVLLVCWILGGCVAQLCRGSGQTLTDYMVLGDKTTPEALAILNHALVIGGLVIGAALVGVLAIWRELANHRRFAVGSLLVIGLILALILVIPLCLKWLQLEQHVVSISAEPFLSYIFGKSRVTAALYALFLVVVGLRIVRVFPHFLERVRTGRRMSEFVALFCGLGLIGTASLWSAVDTTWLRITPLMLAVIATAGLFIATRPEMLWRLLERFRGTGVVVPTAVLLLGVGLAVWFGVGADTRTGVLLLGGVGLLVILLGVNWIGRWVPPYRALELVESPRVFVPIVAIFAFGFALLYNNQLVNALSYHVSQKHILETVQQSEEGDGYRERLYQTGIGKSSSDNFYTRTIPTVRTQDLTKALRALSGSGDQLLPVSLAGKNTIENRLIRAFSPANDVDGDGHRDYVADAGVLTGHEPKERTVEDRTKNWSTDQWKGQWLIDSDGWIFPVRSNTATTIHYDAAIRRVTDKKDAGAKGRKSPRFSSNQAVQSRYILDSPDAADHGSSAMLDERLYFLLPKIGQRAPAYSDSGSFSDLNHQYRKLSGGRHLKVLDDRSSQILLATNAMRPGEEDKNWLRDATMDDSQFLNRVKSGLVRGTNPKKPLAGIVNWEDKLLLVGWAMDSYALSKGQTLRIHLFFKVLKPLKQSMKLFMHIDRAGHRIHGDHWPHPVKKGKDGKHCIGCFQTNHWLPGDIVVDTFEQDIPIGAPSGKTDIWLGLFNPQNDKRLPVTKWDRKTTHYPGKDNRVRIGSFEVR